MGIDLKWFLYQALGLACVFCGMGAAMVTHETLGALLGFTAGCGIVFVISFAYFDNK